MSAATSTPAGTHGLSAFGILRSEWIKLRTVRSTIWCYGLLIVLLVGISLLVAVLSDFGGMSITGENARSAVVAMTTGGLYVAVLIVAVLGSLIVTGEYSTGMIRATFTAAPRRTGALIAKAIVLVVTTFIATSVGIWGGALIAAPILEGKGIEVQLGDPSVYMPLLGGAVYVAMIALLAFGFGTLLRSTAGSLATVLGLILVAPVILQLVFAISQADWANTVNTLLPQNAGRTLFTYASADAAPVASDTLTLNGWSAFGVLAAWNAVVLAIALVLVKRRDA